MNYFRMQMFIWNNIFFSLGFDVRDHYKDFGGDAAAYTAPVSHIYFYILLLEFTISKTSAFCDITMFK